jgi:hypothetical protein
MEKNITDSADILNGVQKLVEKDQEDETSTDPEIEEIKPLELQ